MKRLIRDGTYTSLIGLLVLIFIMMMLWFGKANTTEMAGWLAFAATMFRAKDTILGIQEKKD
jgi:hypothetical protein